MQLERLRGTVSLFKCRIGTLVVTDSSGGFGTVAGFHSARASTSCAPTRGRTSSSTSRRRTRRTATATSNSRFDSHDLDQHDEIRLFGIDRTIDPLDDAEL